MDAATSEDYIGYAVTLKRGAEHVVRDSLGVGDGMVLPFFLLIGFSVETALKAFLLHSGMAPSILRRPPFQHDLNKLLTTAVERGIELEEQTKRFVAELGPHHQQYVFRYPDNATIAFLPRVPAALVWTDDLLRTVHTAIGEPGATKGVCKARES